ncbi:hypothetical protein GGS20DRAFT_588669 [Poronia punctata]|nr:hypothetical protein GGS20DRAFT_588669 [Poronia punctata]
MSPESMQCPWNPVEASIQLDLLCCEGMQDGAVIGPEAPMEWVRLDPEAGRTTPQEFRPPPPVWNHLQKQLKTPGFWIRLIALSALVVFIILLDQGVFSRH